MFFSIWAIALAAIYIIRGGACSCCVCDHSTGACAGACDRCCFGGEDERHAASAVQPYVVKSVVSTESTAAAGTDPRYILMPVNAGQMPNYAATMTNDGGEMPNAADMPNHAAPMPNNADEKPNNAGEMTIN